jgi:hypothetical protein
MVPHIVRALGALGKPSRGQKSELSLRITTATQTYRVLRARLSFGLLGEPLEELVDEGEEIAVAVLFALGEALMRLYSASRLFVNFFQPRSSWPPR